MEITAFDPFLKNLLWDIIVSGQQILSNLLLKYLWKLGDHETEINVLAWIVGMYPSPLTFLAFIGRTELHWMCSVIIQNI